MEHEKYLNEVRNNKNETKTKESTARAFLDHFSELGFSSIKNDDLSIEDTTLFFANSTMCRFKKEIKSENIPESGIVLDQLCLRSKNISKYFDDKKDLLSPTLFRMIGTITNKEKGGLLYKNTILFLKKHLNIKDTDLIVKTSEIIPKELDNIFRNHPNINILYDTENKEYYKWKYGGKDFYGIGATFCVVNKKGEKHDIGEIIAFIKDSNIIGYETAFGLERLLSIVNDKNYYHYYDIMRCTEYKEDNLYKKVLGAITCACELINQNIKLGSKGKEYVLKKYVQAILYLNTKIKNFNLDELLVKYIKEKSYPENVLVLLKKYLNELELSKQKNINNFIRYIKNNKEQTYDFYVKIGKESFSLNEEEVELCLKNK